MLKFLDNVEPNGFPPAAAYLRVPCLDGYELVVKRPGQCERSLAVSLVHADDYAVIRGYRNHRMALLELATEIAKG